MAAPAAGSPARDGVRDVGICLVGFGAVGRAFAKMLLDKGPELRELDVAFHIVAVATRSHGACIRRGGIDIPAALSARDRGAPLSEAGEQRCLGGSGSELSEVKGFIREAADFGASILVEAIPVDYTTGQPALDLLREGLAAGLHCVTANKGPVVHGYGELTEGAARRGLRFLFESAVMDGVPVFNMCRWCLRGARVTGFRGLLNSTTNIILSSMEKGVEFDAALRQAQEDGIAEADPAGDIDGWDAAVKVAALATVLFGRPVIPADVKKESISGVTPAMIAEARAAGERWKVLCSCDAPGPTGQLEARVALQRVGPDSLYYSLGGASSAVEILTDVMGPVTVVSTDPTNSDTAFGVLTDCIEAACPGAHLRKGPAV
eukprot:TRINITY_DN17836_c0_g1_i1.p2 TRINITY_DN17836_c0_g1~~TRINITY_DN17836_c0_g1_i1.p2  ORF type:complete len:377 (+),score=77.21 TRINITY_DN17836_c0_g1_i1:83-1213(+)